jgi:hypothetical protein
MAPAAKEAPKEGTRKNRLLEMDKERQVSELKEDMRILFHVLL